MQNVYDGNGNPIPPVYSPFALSYVVDTLGRQISFNYDNNGSNTWQLASVVEPNGGATFSYQQKNLITNFYSDTFGQLTVAGLAAGRIFRVSDLFRADDNQRPAVLSDELFGLSDGLQFYNGPQQDGDGDIRLIRRLDQLN